MAEQQNGAQTMNDIVEAGAAAEGSAGVPIPTEILSVIGEKELIIRQQDRMLGAQAARIAELEAELVTRPPAEEPAAEKA